MTTQVGLELLLFSVNPLSAIIALIETSPLIWTEGLCKESLN